MSVARELMPQGHGWRDKTVPWINCEMFVVDGLRCAYTRAADESVTIHLPGGRSRSVVDLQASGHDVQFPAIWRARE